VAQDVGPEFKLQYAPPHQTTKQKTKKYGSALLPALGISDPEFKLQYAPPHQTTKQKTKKYGSALLPALGISDPQPDCQPVLCVC
jgi:hypothetical protein